MKSLLSPQHYTAQDVFEREKTSIFFREWLFAGFVDDFDKEDAFITIMRAGREIVVQRMQGQLRAFVNACAHRRSRVQTERRGCRPLICPYHGWKYDHTGRLVGCPGKDNFSHDELETAGLVPVRVAEAGPLVFVNLDAAAPSLEEALGDFHGYLQKIHPGVSAVQKTFELVEKTNWKIAIENTLEFYHVGLVHRETFAKLGAQEGERTYCGPHSMTAAKLRATEGGDRRGAVSAKVAARGYRCTGYEHIFFYPNLTLATTEGLSFSIQYFDPLEAHSTRFTTYTLACGAPPGELAADFSLPVARAIAQQTAQFNEAVFREDQLVCEYVQAGLASADDAGLLGLQEDRVRRFHDAYLAGVK